MGGRPALLLIMGEQVLPVFPDMVQVMGEVEYFGMPILFYQVNIFDGDMGALQVHIVEVMKIVL